MVIVSGHLVVDPEQREGYLAGCRQVVEQARAADGCLDFALSPDLLDPGRVNILERWASREQLEAFRGEGTPDGQAAQIRTASVVEHDVTGERRP